jgi:DNA-binding NtrC family response regulator
VLCDELPLSIAHLPSRFASLRPTEVVATSDAIQPVPAVEAVVPGSGRPESLRELEMRAILEGLERNKGNKARTAEELGISLKTLYNKLHQLNDGPLDKTG